MEADLKREIIDKTALKRHGTPQDIARTALFWRKMRRTSPVRSSRSTAAGAI
jgi:hypothetical protein